MAPKSKSKLQSKGKAPARAGPSFASPGVHPFTLAINTVIPHLNLGRTPTSEGHVETVPSHSTHPSRRRDPPPQRHLEPRLGQQRGHPALGPPTGGIVLQQDQIQALALQVAAILQQAAGIAPHPPGDPLVRSPPPSANSRRHNTQTNGTRQKGSVFSRLQFHEQAPPTHQHPSHRAREIEPPMEQEGESVHETHPIPPPPNHQALLERMERLERNQKGGKKADEEERADWAENPPLSRHIMQAPVPYGFKFEPTEFYQGTTDPQDHIDNFESRMLVTGASGAIKCRAFAATLRGVAQAWFKRLPPRSIHSFTEFVKKFKSHSWSH